MSRLAEWKVLEGLGHLSETWLAGEHWTPAKVQSRTFNFLHGYKEKYIDTGSIKPLTDTMLGLFFLSYAVAWPQVSLHLSLKQSHMSLSLQGHAA